MAASIKPWIAAAFEEHDQQYGSDLSHTYTVPKLAQIAKFISHRTETNPHCQIYARIDDSKHKIDVAFDVAATDAYEQSVAGEEPLRLTAAGNAVIRINEYRIALYPLNFNQLVPQPYLLILSWDIVAGAQGIHPKGQKVHSTHVRDIIKKWWIGLSQGSQQAAPLLPNPNPGTAPKMVKPVAPAPTAPMIHNARGLTTLETIVNSYTSRKKPIPDYIFAQPSADQAALLNNITMFGVDIFPSDDEMSELDRSGQTVPILSQAPASRVPSSKPAPSKPISAQSKSQPSTHKGKSKTKKAKAKQPQETTLQTPIYYSPGRESRPIKTLPPEARPFVPITTPSPSPSPPRRGAPALPATAARVPSPPRKSPPTAPRDVSPVIPTPATAAPATQAPQHAPADSSDDELPIRQPRAAPRRSRPAVFSIPQDAPHEVTSAQPRRSSPPPPSSQPTGQTDESDLSDYERSKRKESKKAASPLPPSSPPHQLPSHATPAPAQRSLVQPPQASQQEESLSQSQDSTTFNLSNYAQSLPALAASGSQLPTAAASSSAPQPRTRTVLVPTTEESGTSNETASVPTAPKTLDTTPVAPKKRPRVSGDTTTSADADDEHSLSARAAKVARVEPGALQGTKSVVDAESLPAASRRKSSVMDRLRRKEVERQRILVAEARELPMASSPPAGQRTPARTPGSVPGTGGRPSARRPSESTPSKHGQDVEMDIPKLGGWTPDLEIDGLSCRFVAKAIEDARAYRARAAAKAEEKAGRKGTGKGRAEE